MQKNKGNFIVHNKKKSSAKKLQELVGMKDKVIAVNLVILSAKAKVDLIWGIFFSSAEMFSTH